MLYLFIRDSLPWLEEHGLGALRVFTFSTFQSAIAAFLSFLLVLIFGPMVINWLRRQKIGDTAEFDQAEVNRLMEGKKGTPTMGGVLIIAAITVTTLLLADLTNFYVRMGLVCVLVLGGVGMIDDWLKLTASRRDGSRQGLTSLEKLAFQVGLAAVLSYFTFNYGQNIEANHTFYFPLFKQWQIPLGLWAFIAVGTVVITGSSNAVNLTDGLDGLASGTMAIVAFTFLVLTLVVGLLTPWNDPVLNVLFLPHIKGSAEMAVMAGAMVGACLGFLWYNCHPARVFMGDTGSLALGGLMGYLAIVVRQELMLFLVGGIFVVEALSVVIQVSYFKYTRKRFGEGRRIFLMTPLHHHFSEKTGQRTRLSSGSG